MSVMYTNCRGQLFYLKSSKTKTGKTRYNFTKALPPEDCRVESIPEGYEVSENPTGVVSLRKILKSDISDKDLDIVQKAAKSNRAANCQVTHRANEIIVHKMEYGTLQKFVKFELDDDAAGHYHASRWCFRGSIDDWYYLESGSLSELCRKIIPHIGKESFFELM